MSTVTIPAGTLVKIAGFSFRLREDAVATGEEANLKAGLERLATDADPTPDRLNLQAAFESGLAASTSRKNWEERRAEMCHDQQRKFCPITGAPVVIDQGETLREMNRQTTGICLPQV